MTAAERAIEEPKRTAADSSWDVWSNYYFCPTLCRSCKYFYKENSNWPYHCKGPSSVAASHNSKKEGYKQYDDCRCYEEMKEDVKTSNYSEKKFSNIIEKDEPTVEKSNWEIVQEEKRQKREEEERRWQEEIENEEQQWEHERTHCFYCDGVGFLIDFYGKKFHEECLEKFKRSENGKYWIEEQELKKAKEAEVSRIAEEKRKADEEKERKHQEWLKSEEGQKWTAEQERIKREAEEKKQKECKERERIKKETEEKKQKEKEKKEKESKGRKRLQLMVKWPVFTIVSLVSVFFNDFSNINFWSILIITGVVFIFYKMITGMLNSAYDIINKHVQQGAIVSKLNRFITYSLLCILISALHYGILFLVTHILFRIW